MLPTWRSRHIFELPRVTPAVHKPQGSRRFLQIQATPAADPAVAIGGQPSIGKSPDAVFEVLGAPYSLLSVTLSPSQILHTRRGTFVGLSGNADGVVSTLRILNPTRVALGIPFLFQKITSTSPVNALISAKSPVTSFAVLHLDGTEDWKIAQSKALLAWTGDSLGISSSLNLRGSIANWGESNVTGRGLLALVGQGNIYSVTLQAKEKYTVHPSNVIAYSLSSDLPRPYRFKSSTIRLQIPSLGLNRILPNSKFLMDLKSSDTWKFFTTLLYRIRTWSRRTIWGDRLFLQFEGPTTLLLQSRSSRINEILTTREINEIADAPPGVTQQAVKTALDPEPPASSSAPVDAKTANLTGVVSSKRKEPTLNFATIQRDGNVKIERTGDFKQVTE